MWQTAPTKSDIDSVNIIFDSLKVIKYSCDINSVICRDTRNILNFNDYFDFNCIGKREHGCTYTYTISEEDYEMADSIK